MIFYCHYAHGDLFEVKALLEGWRKAYRDRPWDGERPWRLASHRSPRLFLDQPWLEVMPLTGWMDPQQPWVRSPEGELAVNVWIGRDPAYVEPGLGVILENHFRMHNDLRRGLGMSPLPGSADDYWPDVGMAPGGWLPRQGPELGRGPKVLLCNGPVTSGQAVNADFNPAILRACIDYPHANFCVTQSFPRPPGVPNLWFTDELWERWLPGQASPLCDLPEISLLSRECAVIVGRKSGPHVWAQSRTNWLDERKTFLAFTRWPSAAWNVRLGNPRVRARQVWRPGDTTEALTAGLLEVLAQTL